MKFKIFFFIVLLLSFTNLYSQKIFGNDFSKNESEIKIKLRDIGFYTDNNWQSAKGLVFGKNVIVRPTKTPVSNIAYGYDFLISTNDEPSDVFNIYNKILDSIKSQFNQPDLIIQKNNSDFNVNDIFFKLTSKEIEYYAKWNSTNKRNYTIEIEVKSDANIYLTIKDSTKYRTKEEEDALQTKIQKDFISKLSKEGLGILKFEPYDVSEYTEGTGFRINVFNPTKKIIKYISISFVGYNAVNDKVINRMGSSYINSVKCVGPIKQYEDSEYEWDYIWFNDLVETIKLTSVNVQYMDGSTKQIANIGSVIINKNEKDLLDSFLFSISKKIKID